MLFEPANHVKLAVTETKLASRLDATDSEMGDILLSATRDT